jgi:hypothetical protein
MQLRIMGVILHTLNPSWSKSVTMALIFVWKNGGTFLANLFNQLSLLSNIKSVSGTYEPVPEHLGTYIHTLHNALRLLSYIHAYM